MQKQQEETKARRCQQEIQLIASSHILGRNKAELITIKKYTVKFTSFNPKLKEMNFRWF